MSLRVKSLNSDASFLLIFSPPDAPQDDQGTHPGSFTVLLDPWLSGPSKVFSQHFAQTNHSVKPCVDSLSELPEPDLVLVSQEKSDHCHQETLQQLPCNTSAQILGTPGAVKKIRSWKYFDPSRIEALKKYDERRPDTVYRIPVPPTSPTCSVGEVTVSLVPTRMDVAGLHNAIGITYRPPSGLPSAQVSSYVDLPPTPPASPPCDSARSFTSSVKSLVTPNSTTLYPPPFGDRERTLSVLFSPHGIDYEVVRPYASSHLLAEGALPLSLLMHSFNRLANPWYMGGTVCAGYQNGIEIASNLFAKAWISAHDEEKTNTGVAVKGLKTYKTTIEEVREKMLEYQRSGHKSIGGTDLCSLGSGEQYCLMAK